MALAGAIIRTRKERERKRIESAEANREESLSEVVYSNSRDGADSSLDLSRKSPSSMKKSASKSEFVQRTTKLLSQSFDSEGDGIFESNQSYSGVYIGLVLFCMGAVITFVGLGDKGFKTLELKLIGPLLCLGGVSCVAFKILQCIFPRLFKWPNFRRRPKLTDSESKGTGIQNGHLTGKPSDDVFSPRVTLTGQSTKTPRPQSTVPNFIDDSSDEDEVNELDRKGPRRAPLTRDNSVIQSVHAQHAQHMQLQHKLELIQKERIAEAEAALEDASAPQPPEILLDPKTLET